MTRQSRRLKESVQPKYIESDSDMDDQPGPSSRPLKRKRKAESPASSATPANAAVTTVKSQVAEKEPVRPTKRVRGKRGVLQQLVEMPLDLLFEIFGELDPIDVLNLSRTTKALRDILMSRSSALIWKAALENVPGLPPCPDDLNEPQWVDLLFGRNCHFCDRANQITSQTFAWEARAKGCLKCILTEFSIRAYNCYDGRNIVDLVPSIYIDSQGRRSDRGLHYHNATYKEFVEIEKRLTNLEEREAWFEERKADKQRRVEHASLCKAWFDQRVSDRANDREELRNQRKECLRKKLIGLGYSSMVELAFGRHDFWKEPVIAGALKKDMTDRVWAGMEEKVIDIMEGFRGEYLEIERAKQRKSRFQWLLDLHKSYVESRPLGELTIPVVDLFACDDVRSVLMSDPLEEPLKPEVAEVITKRIPEYTAEWLSKSKQKLLDLVKPDAATLSIAPGSLTEDTLDLAIIVFECIKCYNYNNDDLHHLNRALRHKCTLDRPGYGYKETGDKELDAFSEYSKKITWNETNALKFRLQGAKWLIPAIRLLELDPVTTTVETLDALDPIFELQYTYQGQLTATWRGVMTPKPRSELKIVDEETANYVRAHFNTLMRSERTLSNYRGLFCTRCRMYEKVNSESLRKHLKEEHNIDPATDEDVWVDWDRKYERLIFLYSKHPGATII